MDCLIFKTPFSKLQEYFKFSGEKQLSKLLKWSSFIMGDKTYIETFSITKDPAAVKQELI